MALFLLTDTKTGRTIRTLPQGTKETAAIETLVASRGAVTLVKREGPEVVAEMDAVNGTIADVRVF